MTTRRLKFHVERVITVGTTWVILDDCTEDVDPCIIVVSVKAESEGDSVGGQSERDLKTGENLSIVVS